MASLYIACLRFSNPACEEAHCPVRQLELAHHSANVVKILPIKSIGSGKRLMFYAKQGASSGRRFSADAELIEMEAYVSLQ